MSAGVGLVLYGLVLGLLSRQRPLWLDEILQLIGTRDARTWPAMLHWVGVNPGQVPLAHIIQRLVIDGLGFSTTVARLPSIVFSVLSCAGMAVMGRRLGFGARRNALALVLFAVLPLQFRYSLEARPYAEGLFWSIASTNAFLSLVRRPDWRRTAMYSLTLAAGLYTQPFALFIGVAHMIWAIWRVTGPERRRVLGGTIVAVVLAAIVFLPWFLFAEPLWRKSIVGADYGFAWNGTLSMLGKDLAGSYPLSLLLSIGVAFSFTAGSKLESMGKSLLMATLAVPIACVLAGDAAFHYFFAVRQLVFVLPALALLAADGLANLAARHRTAGGAVVLAVVLGATVKDIGMFKKQPVNWAEAAEAIAKKADNQSCVSTVPAAWAPLYEFFESRLQAQECAGDLSAAGRVVLVATPYVAPSVQAESERDLESRGFAPEGPKQQAGGSNIETFVKSGHPPR